MDAASTSLGVLAAAAAVGGAQLAGFAAGRATRATRGVVSTCAGVFLGVMVGTLAFELVPALLRGGGSPAALLAAGGAGFLLARLVDAIVRLRLPARHSLEDEEVAAFVVAGATDDVVEGATLGLASFVSAPLMLFTAVATGLKSGLEGFAQSSVLRWQGSSGQRLWAIGLGAALGVLLGAFLSLAWAAAGVGGGPRLPLAFAVGALAHASVVDVALNLEWNRFQVVGVAIALAGTGAAALLFVVHP